MDPGSWTDVGATGIASVAGKAYNAIDPNLILVGSTYYMNFGSFWHDIYQVEMNSAATKPAGTSYNIEYDATGTHPCEGSYMFYYSGYYYLLWSRGVCCGYDTYVVPFASYSQSFANSFDQLQASFGRRIQDHDVPIHLGHWRIC
jgi:arabinan endo-1,5-alpha-L-arabinosidase